MQKILVIRLYFPFDVLHVSDYISPSSGATFISCTSHLVCAGTIARRIGVYQIRCTAYKKIAPDDGLIQSETYRAYIENEV